MMSIYYTIIPPEYLFENFYYKSYEKENYIEIWDNGIYLKIKKLDEYNGQIIYMYSNNIYDYLNPQFNPGTLIKFK